MNQMTIHHKSPPDMTSASSRSFEEPYLSETEIIETFDTTLEALHQLYTKTAMKVSDIQANEKFNLICDLMDKMDPDKRAAANNIFLKFQFDLTLEEFRSQLLTQIPMKISDIQADEKFKLLRDLMDKMNPAKRQEANAKIFKFQVEMENRYSKRKTAEKAAEAKRIKMKKIITLGVYKK